MSPARTESHWSPVCLASLLVALSLAACAQNDTSMSPEPEPEGPPVIRQFVVTRADVVHGDWTQLQWRIDGARRATITPDVGLLAQPSAGALSVLPVSDITYTLTASNDHGTSAAVASVTVSYRSGWYVDPDNGDDGNSGATPWDALATLQEAIRQTPAGGTLFVAAGEYPVNLLIDGHRRQIYGGLNPDTFLQEPGYETWIRPPSGLPLEVRGPTGQISVLDHVGFGAEPGGAYAADISDAPVIIQDCWFDGSRAGSGTAMRISGTSEVTLARSHVRGGGYAGTPTIDAAGILVEGSASLIMRNCFVSGGHATRSSSGVDVNTTGDVAIGLSTISASITSMAGVDAASLRLRAGRPAIGGNILFTHGSGKRPAVIEEAADADPSYFEANLIVGVSQPAYDNHQSDRADAVDENGLNDYRVIVGPDGIGRVGENRLAVIAPIHMLISVDGFDYHLLDPTRNGQDNPAVDAMPDFFGAPRYGLDPAHPVDIDGDPRPGTYAEFDRGADELE